MIYAIEECVKAAQRGGVGAVVYFRKEGRALGEVTKYASFTVPYVIGNSPTPIILGISCTTSANEAEILPTVTSSQPNLLLV